MFSTVRRRVADWIAPPAESRSFVPGPFSGPGIAAASTGSAALINDRSALSIAAVWSAVLCYVNTIGALDWYVAERDERGGRRPAPEHPAYDLLRSRPNRRSTSMRLRQAWIGHVATRGNGYLEIEWDARGRTPVALHLMDPRTTEPKAHGDTILYHQAGGLDPLPAEDVLHLAMFGWDGVKGYSPVEFHRATLGVATAQRDYQGGLFANSALASGHLEVPGNLKTIEANQLRANWNRIHRGPANAGHIGILEGGAKFVQTSFSPQDTKIIEGAHFSVEEIARIWNLPQHKLNLLDHATFSNVEEQNIDFYQSSILPWLTAIEQECDLKLLSRAERRIYFTFFDTTSLLRGNLESQSRQDAADLTSGVKSINEVRLARGLNPLQCPAADFHLFMASNYQPIETLHEAIDPAPAAGTAPYPPPATPPTPAPAPTPDALREVLADALGRMVRRESQAARRASRRADFADWLDSFYAYHGQHIATVHGSIGPAARACSLDPAEVARSLVEESRRELRGLLVSVPPDELPGAVGRLCDRWEESRAADLVALLVPHASERIQ